MIEKKPLKIVHVIDLKGFGGTERVFFDFIKYTSSQGYLHYVNLLVDSVHPKNIPLFEKEIGLKRLPFYKKIMGISLPKKPKFIREFRQNTILSSVDADVVVVWNVLSRLEGWIPKAIPTIYYDHGEARGEFQSNKKVQYFFSQIDSAIAVSFSSKRMMELKWHVKVPVHVMLNQLSPQFVFNSQKPRCLNLDQPLCLGLAGRLSAVKCIDLFILAVKALRDRGHNVIAKIVGTGAEYQALNLLIHKYQLTEYIDLPNHWVDDMEMFYSQVDIVISPSLHETCSLACIEAMAMGLPVVSSNVDGQPELIENQVSGICVKPTLDATAYQDLTGFSGASSSFAELVYLPDEDRLSPPLFVNPKHIADAVEKIIITPETYTQFSTHALEKARQFLDFEGLCNKIAQELHRVVKLNKES